MSSPSRFGRLFAACAIVIVMVVSVANPAVAQDEVFDENETQSTVESIRYQLWGVAGVAGVLLVVYIWHTDPSRRQRVADRRRADREHAAVMALDDTFVLPGDIDDAAQPGAPDDPVAD